MAALPAIVFTKEPIGPSVNKIEFSVKIFDPDTSQQYVQTWRNNMSEKDKPKITSPKQKRSVLKTQTPCLFSICTK
jgi:hypothetical protein